MKKIKKIIGLDENSYETLKKMAEREVESTNCPHGRYLSLVFERGFLEFYKTIKKRLDADHGPITQRQTIYLSEDANSKYNETAFKYGYTSQELANLILKTADA